MFSGSFNLRWLIRSFHKCGKIFYKHLKAITYNKKYFELIEICDVNTSKLKKIKLLNNIAKFDNFNKFIKNSRADLIILTSPNNLHTKQSIIACRFNKHVVTEKPMALSYNNSVKMVTQFRKKNLHLFVVKQIRYNPIINELKKIIKKNIFGKLHLINMNIFWNRSQEYYDSEKWRGSKKMDGGVFLNQTSHYLDILINLFGEVYKVKSFMTKTRKNIDVEDTAASILFFKSGMIGSFNVTMLNFDGNLETSLSVIGEKGTVKIGGKNLNKINYWSFKNNKYNSLKDYHNNPFFKDASYGHKMYYKNVFLEDTNNLADIQNYTNHHHPN